MSAPATPEQIATVLLTKGMSCRALGERIGLSAMTVNRIQRSVASITADGRMVTITRRTPEEA
jgi:transposase